MDPKVLFLSDLHLKSGRDEQTLALISFLEKTLTDPPMVMCWVGDVFDLWVGKFSYFKKEYQPLIQAMKALGERNVRMIYFQGNHDLYLEDFWAEELGFEVYRDPQLMELMGKKFFIEHGDLMNPKDRGYLFLKSVLNHRGVEGLIKKLPNRFVKAVGEKMSSASRKKHPHIPQNDEPIRQMIRKNAQKRFQETACDYIITGHVHVEDEWQSPDGKFTSINLGSWHETPKVWSWSLRSSAWVTL